jgi:hypothetical protein
MDELALSQARSVLSPLIDATRVDGFEVDVTADSDTLLLTVAATPAACAECLVPKSIFQSMVTNALDGGGVQVPGGVRIVYPAAHPEG